MVDKIASISSKTAIPIGALAIAWFVFSYVSEIKSEVRLNSEKIKRTEEKQSQIEITLNDTVKALSRIEGMLDHIHKFYKNKEP